jgi:hypothetical protein
MIGRLSLLIILTAMFPPQTASAQDKAPPSPTDDLTKLADVYKIEIVSSKPVFPVKIASGSIDGKPASETEIRTYTPLFVGEFKLYPRELIKKAKLKRVVLCMELSFNKQLRNAVPDFDHDTLFLDVSRGSYNKSYLRKVIHHDFYHIIDLRDDGSLFKDERWAALNPADFKYGNGGKNAQDNSTTSILTDKFPGFLNHYSTTAVEEDKAEVFANLIVDPDYVSERAKKEPVLKAKIGRMKELMSSFCPEVNAAFWEKTQKLKRTE